MDQALMDKLLLDNDERMEKSLNSYKNDLATLRAGRANPHILDNILVDYYGTMTKINQMANVTIPEPRTIAITLWDKGAVQNCIKAIQASNLGINPTNDGNVIRLTIPVLTEERRKELVKTVKKMCEEAKVAVRNIRRDSLEQIKKMKTDKSITEDEHDLYADKIEKSTSKFVDLIDQAEKEKEKEVLSV